MFLRKLFGNPGVAVVTPEEARVKQAAGAIMVDVREPSEWRTGHIQGAVHIPLGSLAARAKELNSSKEIVTVCRSGHRSAVAARTLRAAGFTQVSSLSGGMIAWSRQKLPVRK